MYLIQDFENWGRSDMEVLESYKLGLMNITISKWLKEKVEEVKILKAQVNSIRNSLRVLGLAKNSLSKIEGG